MIRNVSRTMLIGLLAGGCASTPPRPAASAAPRPAHENSVTAVPPTVVTAREALSVNELFDRGMRRFAEKQYALAAADLEMAAAVAPEQPWATLAFYQAGLARDEVGEFSACAENFRKAVHGSTSLPQQFDARVRLIRVLVFLERWGEAGQESGVLLAQDKGIRPTEAIVARGGRAMASLDVGDLERAERDIEVARSLIEDNQLQLPIKIHRDVAVIYFALGELRRKRAAAIQFVPPAVDFSQKLEQRCQLLLDAQSAYSESMRAYDAHWSVMAGYRVGELYAQLHADLMAVVGAMTFDKPEGAQLFEAALRLRYAALLRKALTLMDHTLSVAARTHDDSHWVELTRESQHRLTESLSSEEAALGAVPYSREELAAALQNLRGVQEGRAHQQSPHVGQRRRSQERP